MVIRAVYANGSEMFIGADDWRQALDMAMRDPRTLRGLEKLIVIHTQGRVE